MLRKRDPYWDGLRGILLVMMAYDHWSLILPFFFGFKDLVFQPFGSFSMAEGFVFLSGLVCASTYFPRLEKDGSSLSLNRSLLKRLKKLYLCYVGSLVVAILIVRLWPSGFSNDPIFRLILASPLRALAQGMVFAYSPYFFDILPLYVVFIGLMSLILPRFKLGQFRTVVAISFLVWFLSQFLDAWIKKAVDPNIFSAFNPLAWQFLFVLGLAIQCLRIRSGGIDDRLRNSWKKPLLVASSVFVCGVAVFKYVDFFYPGRFFNALLFPRFAGESARRELLWPRLVEFFSFSYLAYISCFQKFVTMFLGMFAVLGRSSLFVFLLHIAMYYFLRAVGPRAMGFSVATQVLCMIGMIGSLFVCAHLVELVGAIRQARVGQRANLL
jgi:hypothetical protein